MTEMAIKAFIVDPDSKEAAVELWMGDKPLGHISLNSAALEKLIHRLAECRAELADEVPPEYRPLSVAADAEIDPLWSVLTQPGEQTKVLALRHAGLGWLPFVLPAHQQLALSKVLAAIPPSGTAH